MKKHRDALEDLHIVLLDCYGHMHERAVTKVSYPAGVTEEFQITVGVHQGSVLSPLLFIAVLDYFLEGKVTNNKVQQLFYADDGAIISEDPSSLLRALDVWIDVLEGNGYRISAKKTEYLFCPFSDPDKPISDIYLSENVLSKFKYLGSMINSETSQSSSKRRVDEVTRKLRYLL